MPDRLPGFDHARRHDFQHVLFEDRGLLDTRKIEGHDTSPTTVDWNADGVPDLLVGAEDGRFYYLKNSRTAK